MSNEIRKSLSKILFNILYIIYTGTEYKNAILEMSDHVVRLDSWPKTAEILSWVVEHPEQST